MTRTKLYMRNSEIKTVFLSSYNFEYLKMIAMNFLSFIYNTCRVVLNNIILSL